MVQAPSLNTVPRNEKEKSPRVQRLVDALEGCHHLTPPRSRPRFSLRAPHAPCLDSSAEPARLGRGKTLQIPVLFLSLQQLFILAPCARQIIVCSCFNLPNPGWKNTTQQVFIVGMLFIAILFVNKTCSEVSCQIAHCYCRSRSCATPLLQQNGRALHLGACGSG